VLDLDYGKVSITTVTMSGIFCCQGLCLPQLLLTGDVLAGALSFLTSFSRPTPWQVQLLFCQGLLVVLLSSSPSFSSKVWIFLTGSLCCVLYLSSVVPAVWISSIGSVLAYPKR